MVSVQKILATINDVVTSIFNWYLKPIYLLAEFFLFIRPLAVGDLWSLITSNIGALLFPHVPEDDRKNNLDKTIQIIAKAPQDNVITKFLLGQFLIKLWEGIDKPFKVEPPPGLTASLIPINKKYRLPDGSGNSAKYPIVGMSNTHYEVLVKRQHKSRRQPKAGDLFDDIMRRPDGVFVPHPNGVNVVMFYVATIITHDLFWSGNADPTINTASSYLDLQPLYGRSEAELKKVRSYKDGKLWDDYFADVRISGQLPGVAVLLILFSRNHNFIAEQILELNENNRFSRRKYTEEEIDERVFQTARLINLGCYMNLIVHDYIRTILGLPSDSPFILDPALVPPAHNPINGNQAALSFGYVYRWHSTIGKEDTPLLEKLISVFRSSHGLDIAAGLPIYGLNREPADPVDDGNGNSTLPREEENSKTPISHVNCARLCVK